MCGFVEVRNILIKVWIVVFVYAASNTPHRDHRTHRRSQTVKSDMVNRIFKGEKVVAGDVPFIVRLSIYKPMYSVYLCGGSLIAKNWVITAAHCVEDYESTYKNQTQSYVLDGFAFRIVAGDIKTSGADSAEVQKLATQVYIHGNYDSVELENDIALLYVEEGFELGSYISTVNLGSVTPAEGTTVTVAGWGLTENGDISDTLLRTTYTVPSQSKCVSNYKSKAGWWPVLDGMWCTGFDSMGTHSAPGDSGGPVFRKYSDTNTTLYGLVSWGEAMDKVSAYDYDVNTEVAYFHTWITGIMATYKNYRQELTATATPQTIHYTSGSNTLVYMMYNLSCVPGSYVKVNITKLLLPGDLSHIQLRSGAATDSPILVQLHLPRTTSTQFTSTTNKMLVIFRTTDYDLSSAKSVQFAYSTAAVAGDVASEGYGCDAGMEMCANGRQCFDALKKCDGTGDCWDNSDEAKCSGAGLAPAVLYSILIVLSAHVF